MDDARAEILNESAARGVAACARAKRSKSCTQIRSSWGVL